MEIARAEKDYDKMDLIGKAIQRLEDDIKLHKVKSSTDQKTIDIGSIRYQYKEMEEQYRVVFR